MGCGEKSCFSRDKTHCFVLLPWECGCLEPGAFWIILEGIVPCEGGQALDRLLQGSQARLDFGVWSNHRMSFCSSQPKPLWKIHFMVCSHSSLSHGCPWAVGVGRADTSPHPVLKRVVVSVLPRLCSRFLWSRPDEYRWRKAFLGAGFGMLLGLGECVLVPGTAWGWWHWKLKTRWVFQGSATSSSCLWMCQRQRG